MSCCEMVLVSRGEILVSRGEMFLPNHCDIF